MKGKILFIVITYLICNEVIAQSLGGFEQYYYFKQKDTLLAMVPMLNFQNSKGWYTEARFNYEDFQTFSIYGGKMFSKEKDKLSYSIIPMLGSVFGRFKGGSVGTNINVEYKKYYFSSQTQYTFSIVDKKDNFFYSWSELGYQPTKWIYGGVAIQQTNFKNGTELGAVLGFTFGKWTLPLYSFSPFNNSRYFIVGLIRAFGFNNNKLNFNASRKKKSTSNVKKFR